MAHRQGHWGKHPKWEGAQRFLERGFGTNTFVFDTAPSTGFDTILNFNHANDTIQLDNAIFTQLHEGVLASGAFRVGTQSEETGDRIIYNPANGDLLYDPYGPWYLLGIFRQEGATPIKFASLSGILPTVAKR